MNQMASVSFNLDLARTKTVQTENERPINITISYEA